MMNLTPAVRWYFIKMARRMDAWSNRTGAGTSSSLSSADSCARPKIPKPAANLISLP